MLCYLVLRYPSNLLKALRHMIEVDLKARDEPAKVQAQALFNWPIRYRSFVLSRLIFTFWNECICYVYFSSYFGLCHHSLPFTPYIKYKTVLVN